MREFNFKILLLIVFAVHIVFSFVIGTLNPFEFSATTRFFEVIVMSTVFFFSMDEV